MKMRRVKKKYLEKTVHTKISYYTILLAIVIQIYLFIRHSNTLQGQLSLFEALMGISGLLLVDFIRSKNLTIIRTSKFQKPSRDLFFRTVLILAVIGTIQVFFQIIPLTFKDYEFFLAVIFAAPCEEVFFRSLILEPFIQFGKDDATKLKITENHTITYTEMLGILLSSLLFTAFHINYFSNQRVMLMVFFGGLFLGFAYIYYKDLTALILGHFCLNILVVWQTFFLIGGLT